MITVRGSAFALPNEHHDILKANLAVRISKESRTAVRIWKLRSCAYWSGVRLFWVLEGL
jgi:hypothetical protein